MRGRGAGLTGVLCAVLLVLGPPAGAEPSTETPSAAEPAAAQPSPAPSSTPAPAPAQTRRPWRVPSPPPPAPAPAASPQAGGAPDFEFSSPEAPPDLTGISDFHTPEFPAAQFEVVEGQPARQDGVYREDLRASGNLFGQGLEAIDGRDEYGNVELPADGSPVRFKTAAISFLGTVIRAMFGGRCVVGGTTMAEIVPLLDTLCGGIEVDNGGDVRQYAFVDPPPGPAPPAYIASRLAWSLAGGGFEVIQEVRANLMGHIQPGDTFTVRRLTQGAGALAPGVWQYFSPGGMMLQTAPWARASVARLQGLAPFGPGATTCSFTPPYACGGALPDELTFDVADFPVLDRGIVAFSSFVLNRNATPEGYLSIDSGAEQYLGPLLEPNDHGGYDSRSMELTGFVTPGQHDLRFRLAVPDGVTTAFAANSGALFSAEAPLVGAGIGIRLVGDLDASGGPTVGDRIEIPVVWGNGGLTTARKARLVVHVPGGVAVDLPPGATRVGDLVVIPAGDLAPGWRRQVLQGRIVSTPADGRALVAAWVEYEGGPHPFAQAVLDVFLAVLPPPPPKDPGTPTTPPECCETTPPMTVDLVAAPPAAAAPAPAPTARSRRRGPGRHAVLQAARSASGGTGTAGATPFGYLVAAGGFGALALLGLLLLLWRRRRGDDAEDVPEAGDDHDEDTAAAEAAATDTP